MVRQEFSYDRQAWSSLHGSQAAGGVPLAQMKENSSGLGMAEAGNMSMETEMLPDDYIFDHDSVQSLSQQRCAHVPRPYIHSSENRSNLEEPEAEDIPVIDLATKNPRLSADIGEACRNWGFFQVVNHGVPLELLKRMRQLMADYYHGKPVEEKLQYSYTNHVLHKEGLLPPEGFASRYSKGFPLNWKDQFLHYTYPPSRRNPSLWPADPPHYRSTIMEYSDEIVKLQRQLFRLIAESLGLEANYLEEALGDPHQNLLINYYCPCPQPELALGVRSHSDDGSITILLQGDVPGLQIQRGDKWLTVQTIPDALVVNVGNMLQILSNDKYPSVQHRVFLYKDKARQSIAAFHNVSQDRVVSPAKPLINENNPPVFRDVLFADHLRAYFLTGKNTAADGKRILDSYYL